MKRVSVGLALGAVSMALAFSAPVEARHYRHSAGASHRIRVFTAESKANAYCMTCHGRGATGFRGYVPIPQLAGQQAEYIKIQLEDFAAGRRERNNPIVKYSRVHGMSPESREALAQYLSNLQPVTHGRDSGELVAAGEKIFHGGIPDSDVPACAVCHGPEAKGNLVFPRLAGQLRPYIISELSNWDKKRGLDPNFDDNAKIMSPIANHLSKDQIQAVAAYLSSLK